MPKNYSLQLNGSNPISNNTVNLQISPYINGKLKEQDFTIMNISKNSKIGSSEYSIASQSNSNLTDTTTFQIKFTGLNFTFSTTPISIQFDKTASIYSNVVNVFSLALTSLSNNSVAISVPNRIDSNITYSNLIIENLSTNINITNYSISQTPVATPTSCTITFPDGFLSLTPISIQFQELDSNNNIIAISTFAYINFPSPYDSTIQISKPYLVKYLNTIYKIKITLKNNFDATIPTEYKVIYKATEK